MKSELSGLKCKPCHSGATEHRWCLCDLGPAYLCLHLLIRKMEMITELPWQIAARLDTISQRISPTPAPFTTCSINVKHHWQSFTSEPHLQKEDNYTPGVESGGGGGGGWEMNDKNVCKVASISNEQWPHRSREPGPCVNSSVSPPESP